MNRRYLGLVPLFLNFQNATCSEDEDNHSSNYLPVGFADSLKQFLHRDQIDFCNENLRSRGKPWSSFHTSPRNPQVIVTPHSTEEVSRILSLCSQYLIPVVPFGGGTSLEGQTLAIRGGLSLDMNAMKEVIHFSEQDMDATVQAGLGYVELNDILRSKGLWFPLDPGPGASIGGMCACRCSGSTAVRYGSMRDNVLGITAVLSDGTIVKAGSRARKSSAGYDLTRLLIGSEGTLAIITEVTLKLHSIPRISHAVRISFPNVRSAAMTARDTLNCGVNIGRCELLDDSMVNILNMSNSNSKAWFESTTLLYEVTGLSFTAVNEQIQIIQSIAQSHGGFDIVTATDATETANLWKMRKECLWSTMSQFPQREAVITDACVPLSELPDIIDWAKSLVKSSSIPSPIIAHAGSAIATSMFLLSYFFRGWQFSSASDGPPR